MKGFEISTNIIVIVIIIVILLSLLMIFITSQSATQSSAAEANRIFSSQCAVYKENGCDWAVTRFSGFGEFTNACRVLYGDHYRDYSCIYDFCCLQSVDAKCEGLCAACKGNSLVGVGADTVGECMDLYNSQCESECII